MLALLGDVKDKLYFVIDNIIQNTKAKKRSLRKLPQPGNAGLW
jgi:hypothetical protein